MFPIPQRICFSVLAFVGLLLWSEIGNAQAAVDCQSFEREAASVSKTRQLADVFHRRPSAALDFQRTLKNGVVWRLVTDTSTGLALPRITEMSDRAAMGKANLLLEAAHGCLLLEQAGLGKPRFAPPKGILSQPDSNLVELAYASQHLVSYVDMRVYATDDSTYDIRPKGVVLDLDKGRAYEALDCEAGKASGHGFKLASFLDVCSVASQTKFLNIWLRRIEQIEGAAHLAPDNCERRMGTLESAVNLAMYVTEGGLAIYDSALLSGVPKICLDAKKSLIGPIVIPYRDLEAFLKPGLWRDELLKSSAR